MIALNIFRFSALALLLLLPLLSSASQGAHREYGAWRSGEIGGGGYLQRASFCAAAPDVVYLASDVGGLYRSADGEKTWSMLHGALPAGEGGTQIRGVLAHASDPDSLLVAAGSPWDKEHGVYRSTDGGRSFELALKGHFEGNDWTRADGAVLVADPSDPLRVYAAPIGAGLFVSDDFGANWRHAGLADVYARDIVVDRANPARVWVNAAPRGRDSKFKSGMFVTEDGGASWVLLPGAELPIEMLQDPKNPALLHAAFRAAPQLRYSDDGAKSWKPYANPEIFPAPGDARSDGTYAALAAGPDFVLAAGHGGHFYKLRCGSLAWEKLPPAVVNEGGWYAARKSGVEQHFGAALGFAAVSPRDPNRWLFTDWYACYVSPDAGMTWNLAVDGIEMTVAHCVAQDPSNPKRVHAGMADVGYFRSDDGGASFPHWGRRAGISSNIKHISVSASKPSRLYAVGPRQWHWHANQTFRSDDGGGSWTRPAQRGLPNLDDEGGARCNTIAAHPKNPDEVWLVVSGAVKKDGGGVYRSVNGGDDWEWLGDTLPRAELFRKDIWVSGPELAVSADGSAVAMSNDSGRGFAWDAAAKQWRELALPGLNNCVAADPLAPGRFYTALRNAGLWRSDDGGKNWTNVFQGNTSYVAVDGAKKDRVALSSNGETYWVSDDAGAGWREIPGRLPFRHWRNSLCFAGERLVCGTGGSGVFWCDLAALENDAKVLGNGKIFGLKTTALGDLGASVEAAAKTTAPNLVSNPSATDGGAAPLVWSLSGGANETKKYFRDEAQFATAPASVRLEVKGGAGFVHQRLSGNPAGKTLEITLKSKTRGQLGKAQIVAQCFDPTWKQVDWRQVALLPQGDVWRETKARVALPGNAANVMLGVLADGEGSVWFDDVTVSEAGGAASASPAQMAALITSAQTISDLPQTIAPSDPRLHYEGRWDRRDKQAPQAAWTAASVAIRFAGKNLNAKISTTNNDAVQIFIDGKDEGALFLKGKNLHRVASDLPDGEHLVELVKRTEPIWGVIRFEGFQLDAAAGVSKAAPRGKLLLAIGDSITAAYGNEAPGKEHKFSHLTENGADSYAAFAARETGADYACVAWSGRKMWPNNTIGEVWPYTLPWEKIPCDIAAERKADAVVIGFSGNDFNGGRPDEKQWTAAYAAFIADLRKTQAPAARVYLFASPMTWGADNRAAIRRYIEKVVELRQKSGDKNVVFLDFPMQDAAADGIGADWHPSTKTHKKLGAILADALKKDLGWRSGAEGASGEEREARSK